MFSAGSCFFVFADGHVWVVISDPEHDQQNVLYVNLTSFDASRSKNDAENDPACILMPGEHPFVTHPTCIYYYGAQVCSLDHLHQRLVKRQIRIQESASTELLEKIRNRAGDSMHMQPDHFQILIDQNLVV